MQKKIGALLISLILVAAALPISVPTVCAEETIPAPIAALPSIEEQVRAYARSINQSGADDAAAWALAIHGVTGGGRKLTAGEAESLTALLMNAGMTIAAITDGCRMGIRTMQQIPTLSSVFVDGGSRWSDQSLFYTNNAYLDENIRVTDRLNSSGTQYYTDTPNAYDASMIWIAGTMAIHQQIVKGAVTKDAITYHVTVTFEDRFDFSTGNASISKELASILGSALFREFDWEATVRFTLTVPNPCNHTNANYHFTFDFDRETFAVDTTTPFASNGINRVDWYNENNSRRPYHLLDESVVLYHDMPWVMEYTVHDPNQMIMGTTPENYSAMLQLLHTKNSRLVFAETFTDAQGKLLTRWMGIPLDLPDPEINVYTVRLENRIHSDGSNMVYASVYNETLQAVAIPPTPMDNVYIVHRGVITESYTHRNDLSGKDLILSYMGSRQYLFDPRMFDMKIWEAGESTIDNAYDIVTTNTPTCTEDGGVTHTCRICGYATFEKTTDKLGHNWDEWTQSKAPTCATAGTETRTCNRCKKNENRNVAALPHRLIPHEGQRPTCTETGWEPYEACTNCTYTTYTVIPTTPHAYTHTVTSPTCISQGYTTHTCMDCGDSYTDTYTTTGQHTYQFSVIPPTCGAAGQLVSICQHCGHRMVSPYGNATGRHTYEDDRDPDCNGCGAIREVAVTLLGDANGDGKVNNRDLGLMQQYLSQWDVTVDATACDLDNNGKVNNRDLGILQQQLSGF